MDKITALEIIRKTWDDEKLHLGDKIVQISTSFYATGLDLATTAEYIKATPAELDALLSLGKFDDATIERLSVIDPPRTTWTLLASANDDEMEEALVALESENRGDIVKHNAISEYIYRKMVEVAEPTINQKISKLPADLLKHMLKKGQDHMALNDWEIKFLKSIAGQKKRGYDLSEKQLEKLAMVLDKLVTQEVITRNSIDSDQEYCDIVLDALGKNHEF